MPNIVVPPAPKKAPYAGIPPSSPFYTENNNNLTNENVENIKEVNIEKLVEEVKRYPGNKPFPFSPSPLNLPPRLQGGKTKRRRHSSKKTKRSKRSRKH